MTARKIVRTRKEPHPARMPGALAEKELRVVAGAGSTRKKATRDPKDKSTRKKATR